MPLPKIETPTFELTQPSTQEKVFIRPFLVKEEKILLMAKESGERIDVYNAVRQIVANCVVTDSFNIDTATLYDIEYLFLKIRAVSIDNMVNFTVEDSTDGITYDLQVDLNEVEVTFPEGHSNKIEINETCGMVLRHLTPAVTEKIAKLTTLTDISYATIQESIDHVYDEDDVYSWKEVSQKEKDEFMENLPLDVFKKIETFFESTPAIHHVVEYENSAGETKKVVFRNIDDFFTLY